MKRNKLIWCAFSAIVFAAFFLVGCEMNDYSIKAPANLQHRIDSIAAAKAGMSKGDTTYIDMTTKIVGAADNGSGFWTAFSDYFTIPANKLLHLEFVNHGTNTGLENYYNWNLAVTNQVADRSNVDYKEYFVLRSDAYGWGNGDFNINLISQNYPDTDGNSDIWNDFRKTMEGAYVSIDIDHSATGTVFVKATAVGTNGITLVETYNQPVSATDNIVAFLVADHSHFDMKKAYLLPSKAKDANPTSIAVTGAPPLVKLSKKNFWGNSIATVTFADGSSKKVDSLDLSFTVIPNMTTTGNKTVIVAYSKTKQGSASAKAVSTLYNLEVVTDITQIGASDFSSTWPTYSSEYTVASSSSKTFTMYCYSDNLANWHSPSIVLRKADKTEYAVVRMDNFGWGSGYGTATLTSDWNWSVFQSSINGSKVVIKVTNNGNNTADVRYDVTYASGAIHFQQYAGITVNSSDLNCALVLEEAYVIVTSVNQ